MHDWLTVRRAPSPYIFSLPHSGVYLPPEVKPYLLPERQLALPNSDWQLNTLYDFLFESPVNLISTAVSRYVVDLNRSPESELFGDYRKSRIYDSNTRGDKIYQNIPPRQTLRARIDHYYTPYHSALDQLVERCVAAFGKCHLIDLHSFMVPLQCDVCLGNRDGKSCSAAWMRQVRQALAGQGFRVAENRVFKGGYITAKYSQWPEVESLQIELSYTNYMNSHYYETVRYPPYDPDKFDKTQLKMKAVFEALDII